MGPRRLLLAAGAAAFSWSKTTSAAKLAIDAAESENIVQALVGT